MKMAERKEKKEREGKRGEENEGKVQTSKCLGNAPLAAVLSLS